MSDEPYQPYHFFCPVCDNEMDRHDAIQQICPLCKRWLFFYPCPVCAMPQVNASHKITTVCDDCHEERLRELERRQNLPTGGQSCVEPDEGTFTRSRDERPYEKRQRRGKRFGVVADPPVRDRNRRRRH